MHRPIAPAPAYGPGAKMPARPAARVGADLPASTSHWNLGEYRTKTTFEARDFVSVLPMCGPSGGGYLSAVYIRTGTVTANAVVYLVDTNDASIGANGVATFSPADVIVSMPVESDRFYFFEPAVTYTEEEECLFADGRMIRRVYQLRARIRYGLRVIIADGSNTALAGAMHLFATWWYR